MAIHDFTSERLFVGAPLSPGAGIAATPEQANYLLNVLRLSEGQPLLVFNGRDGEWRAEIRAVKKRGCTLAVIEQTRPQTGGPDIDYLFAPLKRSRLDYMVQKATEMGVARLRPVLTRRTIADRVNVERMQANVIEAAEQCGVLRVPEVMEPQKLDKVIAGWDASRRLVFCDEGAPIANPLAALAQLSLAVSDPEGQTSARRPALAVLIGPEGGFDPEERALILGKPYTCALSLGPRIMRADTAAVAALALLNATLGDWR